MAKETVFNPELEPGDLTIYGTVKSVERIGSSVKVVTHESPEASAYLSEARTSTVFTGSEADELRRLNGWTVI